LLHEIAIVKPGCIEDMLDEMGDWMPDNEVDAIDNAQAEADEAQDPTAAIVYIYIYSHSNINLSYLHCVVVYHNNDGYIYLICLIL
jgi:hypothetical protein